MPCERLAELKASEDRLALSVQNSRHLEGNFHLTMFFQNNPLHLEPISRDKY